jgi:hypothetical protein
MPLSAFRCSSFPTKAIAGMREGTVWLGENASATIGSRASGGENFILDITND